MRDANKHAVRINDLDAAGPELPDEELRATHGGYGIIFEFLSTCYDNGLGGGYDFDAC